MHVYLHGDGVRPPPEYHYMYACPGAHLENTALPVGWVDALNRPKTFDILFVHGRAEVDDELGRYLIKHGFAHKTGVQLFRPYAVG